MKTGCTYHLFKFKYLHIQHKHSHTHMTVVTYTCVIDLKENTSVIDKQFIESESIIISVQERKIRESVTIQTPNSNSATTALIICL